MTNMMLAESVSTIIDLVNKGGSPVLLLLILIGGIKRWWVFGWEYEKEAKEKEEWKALALEGTELAHRALDAAKPRSHSRKPNV